MALIRFLTFCVILYIATAAVIPVLTPVGLEPGFDPIIVPLPIHDIILTPPPPPHDRRQSSVAGRLAVGAVQGLASAGSSLIGQEVAAEVKEKEAEKDKEHEEKKEHEDEKDHDEKEHDEEHDHDKEGHEKKKHDE